ncbi:hypothetical protein [Fodinicurvata halophila]|uniref:hypothetical protein n=1 Tax=Fodinicurvata halophila TaxID=1419723 RepID=UPI003634F5E2
MQEVNISTGLKRVDGEIEFEGVDAERLLEGLKSAETLVPHSEEPRPQPAARKDQEKGPQSTTIRPLSDDYASEEAPLPPVDSEEGGRRPTVIYKGRERAVSYSLRAVWNVHKCVIAANHLNTLWQAEDGSWQRIPDDLGSAAEDTLCRIDCLAARQVGQVHEQARQNKFPMVMVLPIHVQSLASRRNREELGRLLKAYVAPYASLTLIELCGVNTETPLLRLGKSRITCAPAPRGSF